jgi:hypothetical protein
MKRHSVTGFATASLVYRLRASSSALWLPSSKSCLCSLSLLHGRKQSITMLSRTSNLRLCLLAEVLPS